MRYHLSILLFALAQPVFADAYKCRSTTGQVIITDRPCAAGYSVSSSVRSYSIDAESHRQSQADLKRQKEWLARRAAEENRAPAPVGYVSAPSYDRDAIYACLMKITATPGLTPREEASRKVPCYPSGVGLVEECKSSVAATMRLPSNEEAAIKSRCR